MSIFKKPRGTVASIHVYGSQKVGHDTIVALYDTSGELVCKPGTNHADMIGTGDNLRADRSATDALFLAIDALRTRGIVKGTVEIHRDYDFGPRVARIKLEERTPYFGELKFEVAGGVVISVETILAAAEKV